MTYLWKLALGLSLALVVLVVALNAVPFLSSLSITARTQAASDSTACTANGTTCTFTLSNAHENFNTDGMTVTETSPASSDVTSNASLNATDRVTVTMSSLTDAQAYTFNVSYRQRHANVDTEQNVVLTWFVPVAMIGMTIAGALMALRMIRGQTA